MDASEDILRGCVDCGRFSAWNGMNDCSSSLDFKWCERKYSWPVSKCNRIIQLVGLEKTKNET
jgi:hypothetical protein